MTATGSTVVDAVCYGDRSPAQWFVRFSVGRVVYIRYRWGILRATWITGADGVELTDEAILDCPDGEAWFDQQIGSDLDGEIGLARACDVLGLKLALGEAS